MLQFITHCRGGYDEISGTEAALAGGCRWIQLRMKDADDDRFLEVARRIAPQCRAAGATFILDDRVHLVEAVGADGVHLGRNDMPLAEARALLPGKIIGATANTLGHMLEAAAAGADYIGLGPFRFTTTKERLSPVLGLDGYRSLMADFHRQHHIPVVAIGGITAADIPTIMASGVDGIALSGTILSAENPAEETSKIINLISKNDGK